ncbi:MAG: heparinase II/III domain-containing protein [Breznakibacter sp.]
MKRLVFLFSLIVFSLSLKAYETRNLLQAKWQVGDVKKVLVPGREWVPYPQYGDRQAWDQFLGGLKTDLIADGEAALKRPYNLVLATNYLEFERSGSRAVMEQPYHANVNRLSTLMMAELAEGQGRFLDEIVNGVWLFCDMKGWASPAHLYGSQPSKRALPDDSGVLIDLVSGDLSALLSWCHYFFKDAMDGVNPYITQRLQHELRVRTMDPFMQRDDYWWQAFKLKPGGLVNNWNPWCNSNVLITFLLMEEDSDRLAQAVYRTMCSVDQFLNYVKEDGACEEGPSYWGHAAGKLYDYLQVLAYATKNQISLFDEPMVKNMGEYIVNSYIGDGWVVNFADAMAKGDGPSGVIYRYGKAVGSVPMKQFAAYLYGSGEVRDYLSGGRDLFRTLENVAVHHEVSQTSAKVEYPDFCWYPKTEFCYMRDKTGWFFAAKGGYNDESHNHNDVGSFMLFHNNIPMLVDAGVGTYTRKTFSSERYSIWIMQSNYHNLPIINGVAQVYGRQFRSSNVKCDKNKKSFSLDISQAYPLEAAVKQWERTYTMKEKGGLVIADQFELSAAKAPLVINFLTHAAPELEESGVVMLKVGDGKMALRYDSSLFVPSVEVVELDDKRLSNVWGEKLYRLSFTAKNKVLKGACQFVVE